MSDTDSLIEAVARPRPEFVALASRIRSAADAVARVLEHDDGDGMCISDLQDAMYWLRPVIAEVEELESIPSLAASPTPPGVGDQKGDGRHG